MPNRDHKRTPESKARTRQRQQARALKYGKTRKLR